MRNSDVSYCVSEKHPTICDNKVKIKDGKGCLPNEKGRMNSLNFNYKLRNGIKEFIRESMNFGKIVSLFVFEM